MTAARLIETAAAAARAGRYDAAIDAYRQALALDPGAVSAAVNLGALLAMRGDHEAALAAFRQALAVEPDHVTALYNLGSVLARLGRFEAALDPLRRATSLRPDLIQAHCALGGALDRSGRLDEAAAVLRAAVARRPEWPEAWFNLGLTLARHGDLADAEAAYLRAIALRPDYVEAIDNLGGVLRDRGQPEAAADRHRQALARKPDHVEALVNLGVALDDMLRLDDAIECYRAALGLDPHHVKAHNNLAYALLLAGRFEAGWAEAEWRLAAPGVVPAACAALSPQRRWTGDDPKGRVILLWAEQGLGDTIQFARYAPLVALRGASVILAVPPVLVRLLSGIEGVRVVPLGTELPAHDRHAPLLSLPLICATTAATIPAAIPYLHADRSRVADWRAALPAGMRAIGLVWAGNPDLEADRLRSVPLAALSALFDIPGIRIVSLQRQLRAGDAAFLAARRDRVIRAGEDVGDFADTAALVAALDLVIGVDTSVIHLAGALGRPVWLMQRYSPDWRWLLGREDTPWYPTLRQFRQQRPGDWAGVIARIAGELGG